METYTVGQHTISYEKKPYGYAVCLNDVEVTRVSYEEFGEDCHTYVDDFMKNIVWALTFNG